MGTMVNQSLVDAVFFDLGGVVVDSPFEALAALEQSCGAAAGAIRAVNSSNPDDNAWARIERGEISREEFARLFQAEALALGHSVSGSDVIEIVWRVSAVRSRANAAMLDAIEVCRRRGARLALITNNMCPLSEGPHAGWLYDTFDVVIESCMAGIRKPEPAIYESALDQLDVCPQRTVMLDDLGINLKPARALGIRTIKVVVPDDAARELLELMT
jgi:putative hydrolase of the HAD superfamily